jgi:uncharacterized protein YndB with AHSA1/START domain
MTSNDDDYTIRVSLRGSADAAFDALTTTGGLAAWWTEVTGVATRGGELRFTFGDESSAVVMRVDVAEPDRVAWTCVGSHVTDWVATTISYDLTPRADGGCDLAFRHHGLTPQLECYLDCKSGWDHFIASLQALVDTGVGNSRGSAADRARREARSQRREAEPAAAGSAE